MSDVSDSFPANNFATPTAPYDLAAELLRGFVRRCADYDNKLDPELGALLEAARRLLANPADESIPMLVDFVRRYVEQSREGQQLDSAQEAAQRRLADLEQEFRGLARAE